MKGSIKESKYIIQNADEMYYETETYKSGEVVTLPVITNLKDNFTIPEKDIVLCDSW